MKIGIILLNYNGTEDTINCVKSIEMINKQNNVFEVFIVDNNSEKNSINELESFVNELKVVNKHTENPIVYHIIRNKKNIGFSAGNNKAIRYAEEISENDFYLLLNNDTVLKEDSLSRLLQAFKDQKVGAASGLVLDFETKSRIWYAGGYISRLKSKGKHNNYGKEIKEVNLKSQYTKFLTGCYVMFRKEALLNIGLLNESYFFGTEEYDYSLKLRKQGYKLKFVSDSVIYHKVKIDEGNGSSHNIKEPIYIYNSMRNKYLLNRNNYNSITSLAWLFLTKNYIKYILLKRLNKSGRNTTLNKTTVDVLYENFVSNLSKMYVDNSEFNDVKMSFKEASSRENL